MFKFKAHWAGPIQSSKSWESCSSFFDTALQVALVVGCHLRGWHTLVAAQGPTVGEDPGFNITVDFSKVWVTLPPTNHGLAAPPIPVSVAGNELESLVLPAFSVGVWFKLGSSVANWSSKWSIFGQSPWGEAMATRTIFICHPLRMGGPCLALGSALGLALVGLALAAVDGADLAAGGGFGSGVSLAFGGGGLLGFGGVVCAGGVAFAVGAMEAAPVLAALGAPGVGAAGGCMNLVFAGIWDAAMAVALAIGLLELAGNSQTAVGSGSSFRLLAGVGSGGANIHCHRISSGDTSYTWHKVSCVCGCGVGCCGWCCFWIGCRCWCCSCWWSCWCCSCGCWCFWWWCGVGWYWYGYLATQWVTWVLLSEVNPLVESILLVHSQAFNAFLEFFHHLPKWKASKSCTLCVGDIGCWPHGFQIFEKICKICELICFFCFSFLFMKNY